MALLQAAQGENEPRNRLTLVGGYSGYTLMSSIYSSYIKGAEGYKIFEIKLVIQLSFKIGVNNSEIQQFNGIIF